MTEYTISPDDMGPAGLTPRPYRERCRFGHGHCWIMTEPGGVEVCQCATCGVMSSNVAIERPAQLAIAPDASIVAEPVQAPEPRHEAVKLFEPAPAQLEGQLSF